LKAVAIYWVDEKMRVFVSARILGVDEDMARKLSNGQSITELRRCHHRLQGLQHFCERMGGHGRPLLGWYGSDAEHVNQGAFPQDFIDEFLVPNWERVDQLGVMVRHGSAHGHGTHT